MRTKSFKIFKQTSSHEKASLLTLLLTIVVTCNTLAQNNTKINDSIDTTQYVSDKNSLIPLPVVYYTPESGLFFGASALYNFYLDRKKPTSPSQIQLAAGYTTKNQLLIFSPFQFYWKQNQYRLLGELGFYNYAYPFYGLGNNSDPEVYSNYRAIFPRVRAFLLKGITQNLFAGGRIWFENYDIIEWDEQGAFQQSEFSGATGNRTSGIGPGLIYDTRDQVYYPRKGHYLESYLEINGKFTGSTHNYTAISIDYAHYKSLSETTVLAGNLYTLMNFGDVPFNRLAQLGGNKKMRGYFQGYYQDKKLLLAQAEIRQHLFWRIGMVAFASFGEVAEEVNDFRFYNIRGAYGAGIRFLFEKSKHINVRLDYGVGKNSSGFYISFNEAF